MPATLRRTHVYLVRTWIEELGENSVELRGMVRNVQSGETRYFRTWDALVKFVNEQTELVESEVSQYDDPQQSSEQGNRAIHNDD